MKRMHHADSRVAKLLSTVLAIILAAVFSGFALVDSPQLPNLPSILPQTGDNVTLYLIAALALIAGCGLIITTIVLLRRRKRKKLH